ncbi:MAG: TrmH family RNA methyltransferase [Bacteroidota bacterium]|nr:TrmH family RNA methyltransferase [Bacteroidota bacterium]
MKQLTHTETPTSPRTFPIMVLCDGITLPANIGAILRLADAFGVEKIIFGGVGVKTSGRKVKQVSRSTHQWVPHKHTFNIAAEISTLKIEGYEIIALEITDQSEPIHELKIRKEQKIALVIGSEVQGISKEVLNLCNQASHIPIHGRNTSMNVSNALAIILYDITRQLNA